MDEATMRKTEAQLVLWDTEIAERAARLQLPDREARFAAVVHVDELRVLLVTARVKLDALKTGDALNPNPPAAEFEAAWQELTAAFARPMPVP